MNKKQEKQALNQRLVFWKSMTMAEANAFAKKCKTSGPYLRQIAYGHRKASPEMCLRLERLSGHEWTKEALRPDIYF